MVGREKSMNIDTSRILGLLAQLFNLASSFNPARGWHSSRDHVAACTCGASSASFGQRSERAATIVMALTPRLAAEVKERTIWGYWSQGWDEMPDFFKLCVDNWKRHNPAWDVIILSLDAMYDYVLPEELPNLFMDMTSYQTASDAVRLAVLPRYGGIYMDVNILLRCSLDDLCWSDIESGKKMGACFYHPHYGTEYFEGRDCIESWFLATKPGNPFFIKWRDLFCEVLHDRLGVHDIRHHPLYEGIDLSGLDNLNRECGMPGFDFKEYLLIHAMGHRILDTDSRLRWQWRNQWIKIDAFATAFKCQEYFEENDQTVQFALLSPSDPEPVGFMENVPLLKFTSAHYHLLTQIPQGQLLDDSGESSYSHFASSTLVGRLLYDRAVSREVSEAARDADLRADDPAISLEGFNSAILACEEGGRWERAMSLLEEMYLARVRADQTSLNAAIAACESHGKWKQALQILREIYLAGLTPDKLSFNSAVKACQTGGNWERGIVLLEKMREMGLETQ